MGARPHIAFPILFLLATTVVQAQVPPGGRVLRAVVADGDTIPVVQLGSAVVSAPWGSRREAERYTKLMRQVIKVYPYAHLTGQLLGEYERDLLRIQRNADQEIYLKVAEAELRAEFEEELKSLTVGQGRVLVKLIDRETGSTSYDIVRRLRGSFNAFIWQSLAVLFGQDLKSRYDAEGEDRLIEHIVQRIENGELAVADRPARTAKTQARLEKRKARLYKRYGLTVDPVSLR